MLVQQLACACDSYDITIGFTIALLDILC